MTRNQIIDAWKHDRARLLSYKRLAAELNRNALLIPLVRTADMEQAAAEIEAMMVENAPITKAQGESLWEH